MLPLLSGVLGHFSTATRALLFLQVRKASTGREVSLALACTTVSVAALTVHGYVETGQHAKFDPVGIPVAFATWAVFALLVLLLRRRSRPFSVADIVATTACIGTLTTLILIGSKLVPSISVQLPGDLDLEDGSPAGMWAAMAVWGWNMAATALPWVFMLAWTLVAYWRVGRAATDGMARRLGPSLPIVALLPFLFVPLRPIYSLAPGTSLTPFGWDVASTIWTAAHSGEARRAADTTPPRPPVDVEAAWERQPALVAKALSELAASRSDRPELFFVAAAAYAGQDVFKREVVSAREIMDERMGTRGRSLLLVNHRDTVHDLPLANATNLGKVLTGLTRIMDVEKDVLVLYVTSHGSKGEISVSFPRFGFNDLTPERLDDMLKASGIKHRVVILSACHSGSFLPKLEDPGTLVMTAAHADKTSFGCSNEREWTYFGDALFNHALRATTSFVEAFRQAREKVAEWESAQKLTPSEPQVFIGEGIGARLDAVERRLAGEASRAAVSPHADVR